MEYTRTAMEALRTSLEKEGSQGIEWTTLPLDTDHFPDLRHRASGAARLTFLVPYSEPHRLRTLVAHLLERGVWLDVSRLAIRPLGHLRSFDCILDLVFSDPRIAFQSHLVRQKLTSGMELPRQYQAVAAVLVQQFEKLTQHVSEDRRKVFRQRLETYLQGGRESDAASFEDELNETLRPVMLDLRLYVDLPRSHRHVIDAVDQWIERERVLPCNGVRGKTFYREPWPAFLPSIGVRENPELLPGKPPGVADAAELFRLVADDRAPQHERQDALFHLQALPTPEARTFCVRALGYDAVRLNAIPHAASVPALAPLFREIILSEEPRRIVSALDRLRDYGTAFTDPMEAWRQATHARSDSLGEIYQETVLEAFPRCGDRSILPKLIEEIRSRRRSGAWTTAAIRVLRDLRASDAAEAVLDWTDHADRLIRQAALEFYEVADYAPALAKLLVAIDDSEIEVASAAERGLAGQTSAGWKPLLHALDRLHHRAIGIPARSPDDGYRNRLGSTLLRALTALPGRCPDPELVRHSLRRVGLDTISGARRLFGEERERPLPREKDVSGRTPEATLAERMRIWAERGYAAERYRADGHRGGAWDEFVERGHGLYDPDRAVQEEETARAFEEAIRRGCRDGMVHYRLAVCRHTLGDLPRARESYRTALALLPERYPDSAYVLCAEAALGQLARNEGRLDEALEHFRRAVRGDMAVRDVRELLPDLEEDLRAVRSEKMGVLDTGRLLAVPGRRHGAAVTSLELSADGMALLSADAGGWVQVSRIAEDSSPALEPRIRDRAHGEGPTFAAWLVPLERVFVTGGADGLLRRGRFQAGRPVEFVTLHEHPRPIVAVARVSDRSVAFADDEGGVFVQDGSRPRRLSTAWRARIRRLIVEGGRLVALDDRRGIQVWPVPAEGAPEWSHFAEEEIAFADLCETGLLYLGAGGETVKTLHLASGQPNRPLTIPAGRSRVRFARFDVRSGVAVWGYEGGDIRVDGGGAGFHAVTEPLEALDVAFEPRVVAYADVHGYLYIHGYAG